MIYTLISGICVCLGITGGIGISTLLRPLLDAISPLDPATLSLLCTAGTLGAALVGAFFALSQPLPLHQDELLLLAIGALLGGTLGDLLSARFYAMLPARGALFLQNALLFTLLALPAVYFSRLSGTIVPLSVTRTAALPAALVLGVAASVLSFGAVPLTLLAYRLFFDAREDEAAIAALSVALCAMAGKLIVQLIRLKLNIPSADVLLWLLPGTVLGALAAMIPGVQRAAHRYGASLLRLALFSCAINMASAFA